MRGKRAGLRQELIKGTAKASRRVKVTISACDPHRGNRAVTTFEPPTRSGNQFHKARESHDISGSGVIQYVLMNPNPSRRFFS